MYTTPVATALRQPHHRIKGSYHLKKHLPAEPILGCFGGRRRPEGKHAENRQKIIKQHIFLTILFISGSIGCVELLMQPFIVAMTIIETISCHRHLAIFHNSKAELDVKANAIFCRHENMQQQNETEMSYRRFSCFNIPFVQKSIYNCQVPMEEKAI